MLERTQLVENLTWTKLFFKVNVIGGVVIGVIALLVLVRALLKRKKMKAAEAEAAAK